MLQGKKTYIVVGIALVVIALHMLGYIDNTTFETLLSLLGVSAAGTLGAKINRVQNDINDRVTVTKTKE